MVTVLLAGSHMSLALCLGARPPGTRGPAQGSGWSCEFARPARPLAGDGLVRVLQTWASHPRSGKAHGVAYPPGVPAVGSGQSHPGTTFPGLA